MGEEMFCENCGSKTTSDEFCSNCGEKKTSNTKKGKSTSSKTAQPFRAEETEVVEVGAQNLKPHVLNYISLAAAGVLLLGGIVYASATEQRIKELEEQVDYLDSTVAYLESDVSNTQDWAYDELEALSNCINDYTDAFDWDGFTWYYCSPPLLP